MKLGRYAVWCSLEGVPLAEASSRTKGSSLQVFPPEKVMSSLIASCVWPPPPAVLSTHNVPVKRA